MIDGFPESLWHDSEVLWSWAPTTDDFLIKQQQNIKPPLSNSITTPFTNLLFDRNIIIGTQNTYNTIWILFPICRPFVPEHTSLDSIRILWVLHWSSIKLEIYRGIYEFCCRFYEFSLRPSVERKKRRFYVNHKNSTGMIK